MSFKCICSVLCTPPLTYHVAEAGLGMPYRARVIKTTHYHMLILDPLNIDASRGDSHFSPINTDAGKMGYHLTGGLHVKVQPGTLHNHNHLTVELRHYELQDSVLSPKKGLQIPYGAWVDVLETHWPEVLNSFNDATCRPTTWEYDIEPSCQKKQLQKVRVTVEEYNTHVALDFRLWVEDNQKFVPTTHGARLDHPTVCKLKTVHDEKLKADHAYYADSKSLGDGYIYV